MKRLRVAVLMGGPSPEREVSVSTGREIVSALDPKQYNILPVEITKEGKWLPRPEMLKLSAGQPDAGHSAAGQRKKANVAIARGGSGEIAPTTYDRFVEREQVDVAFIAMHGPYGEDGTMQGLLELLGIPYTGSGVLASALAMDKLRSRQIFEWHRIPVPAYLSITADVWRDRGHVHQQVGEALGYPCVVKPNAVGSSIGVSIVREDSRLDRAVEKAFSYGPIVLIEEYIAGTELTCGVLDDPTSGQPQALPLIEIIPHADFYDYDAKYATGGSDHLIPARVSEEVAARAQAIALRSYQALGCEGMGRVDMIARDGDIVVLEINTIPGMTATSLLPDAARAAGIPFSELLDRIIRNAMRRASAKSSPSPDRVADC